MIELTGLRSDLPIGAMAAFGALRLCSDAIPGARLAWRESGGGWHALLDAGAEADREKLVSLLCGEVARRAGEPIWEAHDEIKGVPREEFRDAARQALEARDQARAEWFAALANELICKKGAIEPTPLDMSVARQKFLGDALRLNNALASEDRKRNEKPIVEELEEALFGPWRYTDDQHSLGWDPSTIKLGAFAPKEPSKMVNTGVRAAVWLAFQSLPLFPVLARRGKQQTRSFEQSKRKCVFCWPVWEPPITLAELTALLAMAELTSAEIYKDRDARQDLRARGVVAIYRSEKFKPNKYMVTFRPAELAFSAGV